MAVPCCRTFHRAGSHSLQRSTKPAVPWVGKARSSQCDSFVPGVWDIQESTVGQAYASPCPLAHLPYEAHRPLPHRNPRQLCPFHFPTLCTSSWSKTVNPKVEIHSHHTVTSSQTKKSSAPICVQQSILLALLVSSLMASEGGGCLIAQGCGCRHKTFSFQMLGSFVPSLLSP